MIVHVCGTRGSTPAPGRSYSIYGGHTSSIAVAREGRPPELILDAGTGIRLVTELLEGEPFRGSVLLSHLHWDHTHGLPFFAAGDRADARVDVYMPAQDNDRNLTEVMSPPHFPITNDDLEGEWHFATLPEGSHEIEGYQVLARIIPHKGGRTFGYRIQADGVSVAYLSDHGPAELGPGPDGYGPYHEAALSLARDADLLIHDAQYLEEDWPKRSHFGHSTTSYAIGLGHQAGVRRLLMFHHDPGRTDDALDDLSTRWADEEGVEVIAAREGQVIDVRPVRA